MRWGKVSLVSGAISCGTTLAQTQNANASDIIPGAYIIEFADNYDVNSFMTTSEASGSEIRRRLDYELFNGVSIQLDEGIDVDAAVGGIANIDQVKNVWPVRKIPMPNVTVHWTGNDQDVAASMLKKRQSTNESDAYSPHFMTQVDRLHAEGVKGKGIKIAVIDSGIDYMHPALGGCFGPGCLVSYGAIYAGDESEPLDCIGHGTHVAGIIAAQQNKFGFIGAAPEVELGNYRIGGCNCFASDDDLIAAANQAYQDGSDIISMSLGWSSGWSDEPVAKALTRIVEAGVPCTVAAGNEGASGLFLPSNPASGDKVAAIASVENSELPEILLEASYTTGNSSSKTFGWRDGFPEGWRNGTFPLWSKSWDLSNPDDSCKPIPEGVDLTDHIALIFWAGNCYLDDKIEDAAAHGARFFLVYAESPVALGIATGVPVEGLGAVQYEQGREWEELLAKNVSITLDIVDIASANRFLTSKPNPRGGFVSTYSTWGPGNRMEQKPQFGAPGSYILSTYPVAQGGYAILSGTSMATPLAAAIYALVGQVRGTLDPATIENVLSATAKPNLWHDRTGPYPYLAPTAQQGGGLMQAYDAAFSTTILSASSIAFGDTEHAVSEANFTIRNIGTTDKTYLLSNVRAATGLTIDTTTGLAQWFPNEMTTEGAGIAFDSNEITVPAGGEVMVTVVPTPPDLDASRLPVWSGYIALNSTDGDSISLPYLGLVGSLSSIGPLYKDPARGTMIQDGFGGSMEPNRSYTFPKGELNPDYLYPIPSIVLAWASYVVRVEAIALDESLNTEEIGGVKVAGSVFVPLYFRSRANAIGDWFNGELVNGTYVPEGGYKLLFRALRNYGDENKKEDYDFVESPPFFISYVE